jgi:hypothetical protein
LRWWDGTRWTDYSHTLGVDSGQPLRAPAGTSPYTPWIWIFALLPLLQLAEIPLFAAFYSSLFRAGFQNSSALITAEYGPNSGYWAIQGISFLLYGIYVALGLLDYRVLRSRGVPHPFHWAWSFLGGIVYIIGRTVVVRRRTGAGMAPMWVNIVALIIAVVGSVAAVLPALSAAMSSLR